MTATSTAMEHDRFAAYLPELVRAWLEETPEARFKAVDGTVVLADVSGFTSLTERLARAGQVGAEETSDLLSATFSELLRTAAQDDGHLVKWGGDAVLLLFAGSAHAARACRAAWRMRAALRRVGHVSATAGPVRLRLSVGVHSGRVELYLVGTTHRELIVTGAASGRVVRLQSMADTGQILVGPATTRLLGPDLTDNQGALRRQPAAPHPVTDHRPVSGDGVDLEPLLPAAIRARLAAGPIDGEHRRVAVGFLEFSGVDAIRRRSGRSGVWNALQELIGTTQSECERHDVTFLETDVSRDGGKIMLVSGAPTSHGHEGARLLRTLHTVLARPGALRVRAGANAGRVFAGEFGPPEQRTYSVKGDAVNLAARVMAHAQIGQLLATPDVLGTHEHAFDCTPLPRFRVKGKSVAVDAVEVRRTRHHHRPPPSDTASFVGRDRELGRLRELLARAHSGRGAAVLLCGPPGIGKTRLASELTATDSTLEAVSAACDESGADTPYALFDTLLRNLLHLTETTPEESATRALVDAVEGSAPPLRPWLPLLGTVLGASPAPTPETDALVDEFRRTRLEQSLVDLITALLPGPTLVLIDDAHLADEASASVLTRLLTEAVAHPWLVVLTAPDGLPYAEGVTESMTLRPLRDSEVATLLAERTRDAPLLPHQRAAVAKRAAGNPLFLRELVPLAGMTDAGDLPASVEEVLAEQIDRLAPHDRQTLRAAAAGGVRIDPTLLEEVLDGPVPAELWGRLAEFVEPDGAGQLRFRHALVRDAAYAGLSYRRRRMLHNAFGRALQDRSGPLDVPALALHFFHAENHAAAAHYARIAGELAAADYANAEAATAFSRALRSAGRKQPQMPEEVARLAEAHGDIRYRLGEFAAAETAYTTARRAGRTDPVTLARLDLKTAQAVAHTGGFSHALAWVTRGRHALEPCNDADAARQDARLLVQAALMRQMQGRYDETERECRAALRVAPEPGGRDVRAQAMQLLDAADVARGRFDGEPWAERALTIWESRGDIAWQARARNQLGIRAYFTGSFGQALAHYRAAVDAFERVGDQWNAAVARCNVAEILVDQEDSAGAAAVVQPAAELLRASAALSESAFAQSILGRIALREHRIAEARARLEEARAGYVTAGERDEVVAMDMRLVECLVTEGRSDEAIASLERLAPDAVPPSLQAALQRLRGMVASS